MFFALLVVLSGAAHAQTQSLESVQSAAEKAVLSLLPPTRARYFVSAGHLDSRLRLAQCAAALDATPTANTAPNARATVGVHCDGPTQWTVYVPVSIEVETSILILKRSLARRSPVDPADVELETRRVPGTEAGFITDVGNLAGRRLKRALSAGTPLTADVLVPDVLVKRGQQVTLLASSGPFEIRAQGQALTDGTEHERIRVQNVTSRKIVEGVVENSSTVRVEL